MMPDDSGSAAYQASNLNAYIGAVQILKNISFRLEQGRWLTIVGPNGAGKTSLLKVMAGLDKKYHAIACLGRDLYKTPKKERARLISWLSQDEVALADIAVQDLVMLGRLPYHGILNHASAEDKRIVMDCLHSVDIYELRARSLHELSGGERQRVYIARALAVQAEIYLMDEPLSNLDPQHQADWLALVKHLTAQGKTVVSVMHELSMALRSDQILVMEAGHLVHQGDATERQTHQVLERVFDKRIKIIAYMDQWIVLPH